MDYRSFRWIFIYELRVDTKLAVFIASPHENFAELTHKGRLLTWVTLVIGAKFLGYLEQMTIIGVVALD